MSKMVSARIPNAVYDQALAQLADMGSSPSELVNAAFEYVLEEKKLPAASKGSSSKKRPKLSEDQVANIIERLEACTLDVGIPSDIENDKRIIAAGKRAKYEALA